MAYQLHSPPRDERSDENALSAALPKNVAMHPQPAPLQNHMSALTSISAASTGSFEESTGAVSSIRTSAIAGSGEVAPPEQPPVIPQEIQSRQPRHHNQQRTQSKPIAIARISNTDSIRSGMATEYETDSDLEETSVTTPSTSTTIKTMHHSLPSRLLRAPFLGSVPTNERNLLPPPMRLSDPDDVYVPDDMDDDLNDTSLRSVNYGSLRESHVQGRFLDGPLRLFNERRRTGIVVPEDLHQAYSNHNRTLLSSSAPVQQSGLSIGERIQQQRKLQQMLRSKSNTAGTLSTSMVMGMGTTTTEHANQQISTLAALIEATSVSESNNHGEPSIIPPLDLQRVVESSDSNSHTHGNRNELVTLSSSLTGLQVLRHGLPRPYGIDSSSLLPMPENLAARQPTFHSGISCSENNATLDTNHPQMGSDHYSSTLTALDLGVDRDPDTDGAFDFDME